MRYIAKYWLSPNQYMAVLEDVLVIVTVDDGGEMVRAAIFKKEEAQA